MTTSPRQILVLLCWLGSSSWQFWWSKKLNSITNYQHPPHHCQPSEVQWIPWPWPRCSQSWREYSQFLIIFTSLTVEQRWPLHSWGRQVQDSVHRTWWLHHQCHGSERTEDLYVILTKSFLIKRPTSKLSAKVGNIATLKSLVSPSPADSANFQNWSSWYWGPIREDTMGKALKFVLFSFDIMFCACYETVSRPFLLIEFCEK